MDLLGSELQVYLRQCAAAEDKAGDEAVAYDVEYRKTNPDSMIFSHAGPMCFRTAKRMRFQADHLDPKAVYTLTTQELESLYVSGSIYGQP